MWTSEQTCFYQCLLERLNQMWKSSALCDVVLMTHDNGYIQAHSVVLSAASPVFHLFYVQHSLHPALEKISSAKHECFRIQHLRSEVLEITLRFLYGQIPETPEEIAKLETGGTLLELPGIEKICSQLHNSVSVHGRVGLDECQRSPLGGATEHLHNSVSVHGRAGSYECQRSPLGGATERSSADPMCNDHKVKIIKLKNEPSENFVHSDDVPVSSISKCVEQISENVQHDLSHENQLIISEQKKQTGIGDNLNPPNHTSNALDRRKNRISTGTNKKPNKSAAITILESNKQGFIKINVRERKNNRNNRKQSASLINYDNNKGNENVTNCDIQGNPENNQDNAYDDDDNNDNDNNDGYDDDDGDDDDNNDGDDIDYIDLDLTYGGQNINKYEIVKEIKRQKKKNESIKKKNVRSKKQPRETSTSNINKRSKETSTSNIKERSREPSTSNIKERRSREPSISNIKERSKVTLTSAKEKRSRRKVECEVCHKMVAESAKMGHMWYKHRVEMKIDESGPKAKSDDKKLLVCNFTGCDYKTGGGLHILKTHLYKRHSIGDPTHPCSLCDKKYFNQHQLMVHIRRLHDDRPQKDETVLCSECGAVCCTQQGLNIHMVKEHKRGKVFSCELCDFKSPRKNDYQGHMLSRHDKVVPGTTVYSCNFCPYRTVYKRRMEEHEAGRHTGKKESLCSLCGEGFVSARQLRKHMNYVHSQARPHKCQYCQAQFKMRDKLNDHIRVLHTHRGMKPFKCGYCDHATALRGNCNQHVKKVHPGLPILVLSTLGDKQKKYIYADINGEEIEEEKQGETAARLIREKSGTRNQAKRKLNSGTSFETAGLGRIGTGNQTEGELSCGTGHNNQSETDFDGTHSAGDAERHLVSQSQTTHAHDISLEKSDNSEIVSDVEYARGHLKQETLTEGLELDRQITKTNWDPNVRKDQQAAIEPAAGISKVETPSDHSDNYSFISL